ncbi:MAG: Nicotinate phosphoribosyltransferase [Microgenomates bacterium OLB22]|nr:MAG: Nicotinate phosphoribosyltransferase [Microgenomates bacterium OLB22]
MNLNTLRSVDMRQIITSRLDTDLYKLTMGQFIWSFYPLLRVRYALIDRGNTQFPEGFAQELRRQVDLMSRLRLSGEESSYLSKLGIFNADYLSWFEANNYKPSQVKISQYGSCLTVIIEGPWVETVYWEVPLMSLISELYYKMTGQVPELVYPRASEMAQNLQQAGVIWTDFGSRRRAGFEVQGQALMAASAYMPTANTAGGLVGTSNVHWARVLGLESKGTMHMSSSWPLLPFMMTRPSEVDRS